MKSYKQDVLDAAIEGLVAGGVPKERAEQYRILLDKVYECGYNEAVRNSDPSETKKYNPFHDYITPYYQGCQVCGIGKNGEVMGYVCNRTDCPTRVSCK